jgi:hypothetical protein
MPAFSFHRPRFLRFDRSPSRSPKPSSPVPHDDAVDPLYPATYSPPSSPPFSRLGSPEQGVNVVTGTSHSSAARNSSDPQHSTGRLLVGRAPRDLLNPQAPVALPPARLPCPLNPTESVQSQKSLIPLHSPCSLTTSFRQSLDSILPTVSFLYEFRLQKLEQ